MKKKLSISLDSGTIEQIDQHLVEGSFRNKSHFVEVAILDYMNRGKNDTNKSY